MTRIPQTPPTEAVWPIVVQRVAAVSSESHTFIRSPFYSGRKCWLPRSNKHRKACVQLLTFRRRVATSWPSKNCPWLMLPTDPAVIRESARCELMVKEQGKAVRAPALGSAPSRRHRQTCPGRTAPLQEALSCPKVSSKLARVCFQWPAVPFAMCEETLLGHCELLLLQISSSLPGTFSLERYLHLHLSNTHPPLHQMSNTCPSTKTAMSLQSFCLPVSK